jgi:hypothetical protein
MIISNQDIGLDDFTVQEIQGLYETMTSVFGSYKDIADEEEK